MKAAHPINMTTSFPDIDLSLVSLLTLSTNSESL
ncbi:hypothetical protein predicted by Glimmer/Critica [Lactiplantibacillus plantarum]|nr:hypothetical protein predicted by Glimmer/Critica [Lactiplantibacillus plantarum]